MKHAYMKMQISKINDVIEKINQLLVYLKDLKDCIITLQKINKKKR